jgi:REP element-mobilizing transposase RayT
MQKVEDWLDEGMGSCWLRRPDVQQIVVDALRHYDDDQYELGCFVIMPNHVHAIIRPLRPKEHPLEKVLQGRKLRTSREINACIGRSGTLWQDESFDRIIRDEEHLWRCIQYIGRNPHRERLRSDQYALWIRPSWVKLGWGFGPNGPELEA